MWQNRNAVNVIAVMLSLWLATIFKFAVSNLPIGLDLRDLPISLIRYDRPTKSENMIILLL